MGNIRLQNMDKELIGKFKILGEDNGKTTSRYIKSILHDICDNIPKHKINEGLREKVQVEINGISDKNIEKINNIATEIGITREQYLRVKLFEFIENQPDYIKKMFG